MDAVLEVEAVQHRYGSTVALDGVDLRVAGGECVALLGPNGAGKTTLVDLVTGLRRCQGGRVRVAGQDPARATTRRSLGVMQQRSGVPRLLKVGEVVRGAAIRAGAPPASDSQVLAEVGLTELGRRRVTKLSGGQQQRLQLAMALVADPALLVLDEPTNGLDAGARRDFWERLAGRRDRGAGVLLTTHQVDEAAAVADRVVVLAQGRVVAADTPQRLVSRLPDRVVSARTCCTLGDVLAVDGTVDARQDADRRLVVTTTRPESLVRALLAADPDLAELRVESAGLEQAVLAISGPRTAPTRDTTKTEVAR